MRKIVYPAAAVIVAALIAFLLSMTLSSSWSVQRRVYIKAKPAVIAPYVYDLKKWRGWSHWATQRGVNGIALTCKLPERTTCVVDVQGNREIEECLVMLVPADFGAFVVLKVSGKIYENPLMRYFIQIHNDAIGLEMEESLKMLKEKIEKSM